MQIFVSCDSSPPKLLNLTETQHKQFTPIRLPKFKYFMALFSFYANTTKFFSATNSGNLLTISTQTDTSMQLHRKPPKHVQTYIDFNSLLALTLSALSDGCTFHLNSWQ